MVNVGQASSLTNLVNGGLETRPTIKNKTVPGKDGFSYSLSGREDLRQSLDGELPTIMRIEKHAEH